jgi:hypothetical protein
MIHDSFRLKKMFPIARFSHWQLFSSNIFRMDFLLTKAKKLREEQKHRTPVAFFVVINE